MPYRITFDQKPGYLHAVVVGRNTRENVVRYLEEIRSRCVACGCFRVLIEERLEGPRLGLTDVFAIASREGRSVEKLPTIAYVDVNAVGTSMDFAENVAVNRGINVRVFASVIDAEKWLLDLASSGTEQNAAAGTDIPRG